MIIANQAVAPTMSGVGQTAKATIKASARLFRMFSDMVYADKFVAIWRELVANGQDAQVAAGTANQAVIVTIPTTFTPYAKVRDFGTGMDHDFLMTKFMAYTDSSTKENSNDFIGGFGIGSKAPLSYTEQFAIHSYQGGRLRVYSVYKDADDCPAIAFLSESDTTEKDGIEISFPVEQGDITKFKEAALSALCYFTPTPILKGCTEKIEAPDYSVKTDSWGFRRGKTQSQIVQGGVAYPIDEDSVPRNLHEILQFGIDFFMPIGSVNISLSRESLSYDDTTTRVLTSLCDGIRPKIQEHVNKMFEDIPTKWDAMVEYHKTIYGNTSAGRLVESLAHYKGEKLQRYIQPVMSDKVLCAFIRQNRWSNYGSSNVWTSGRSNPSASAWIGQICPRDIDHIVIDDQPTRPIMRLRSLLDSIPHSEGVMFVRKRPDTVATAVTPEFKNDLVWDDFIKTLGSPKVIYLSTLEPVASVRGTSMARAEKIRGYKGPSRSSDFVDTLPVAGGLYVEMHDFDLKGITSQELEALDKEGKELLYFNKGDFDKVKNQPNWIAAKDKLAEQLKAYKRAHRSAPLAEAFWQMKRIGGSYNAIGNGRLASRLMDLLTIDGFKCPKRGPMARFNTLFQAAKADLNPRDVSMRKLLAISGDKHKTTLDALVADVKATYPELSLLIGQLHISSTYASVFNKLV